MALSIIKSILLPLLAIKTTVVALEPHEVRRASVVELNDLNFESLTQAASGQTTGKWFVNFHSPSKCLLYIVSIVDVVLFNSYYH